MRSYLKVLWILFSICTIRVSAQDYTSYLTGDSADVVTSAQMGIALMGGATEHDEAMKWFLQKANGGDVVVIRATGADGYNTYFYTDLGIPVNSVETIVFHNALASSNSYVINRIANAEAIWIAGGDQFDYVTYWQNTAIDSLLNLHIHKPAVIGGTSAGMAILGSVYFSAENGTVTSATALANPFDTDVTVESNNFLFMPFLYNVITDTHYDSPDRKGRHAVFMARKVQDYGGRVYGIACDEYTAVCIDSAGKARVFGDYPSYDDNAWFIQTVCDPTYVPEVCTTGVPLTWDYAQTALKVCNIKGDYTGSKYLMLDHWNTTVGGTWENWYINAGVLNSVSSVAPDCVILGEDEYTNDQIKVYPNPTFDKLYLNSVTDLKHVRIIDLRGNQLWREVNNNAIDVSDLSPGIYVVHIGSDNSFKFIKY